MVNTPPGSVHGNTPPASVHGNTPPAFVHNDSDNETDFEITRISKLDFGDPLYLHASDTTGTPLIGFKLLGTENYKVWACAIELALETKNKTGFIDGSCLKNYDNPVLAKQWDRCNAVVLNWILGCVSQELYLGQIYSKNASIVWQELKDTYDKVDGSVTFNLYQKINSLSQNGSSLSEYYHKLTAFWKQFDVMIHLPACSCAATSEIQQHVDLMKLMQFLMGLDDSYITVRSNILMKDPLPTVKTAYNICSREESHRGGMGDKFVSSSSSSSSSAFIAKSNFNRNSGFKGNKNSFDNRKTFDNNFESRKTFDFNQRILRPPNPNLHCTHCNKIGHTIDRCFILKNKNSSNQFNNGRFSNNNIQIDKSDSGTKSCDSSNVLTSDQVARLLSLLDNKSGSSSSLQANMAGMPLCSNSWFLSCNSFLFNAIIKWIIDSGANQHMTMSAKNLTNVVDISDLQLKIGHPNGTCAIVKQIGNLHLKNGIILFDVLVVPEYNVNLMYVHKLDRDNNLFVGFDPSTCYIRDSLQKSVLGTGSEQGGLYVYDDLPLPSSSSSVV
uniref:uncharacterized protein LOC122597508 n=1 Tax=Erigeron canadensis TaxID=72917 RepID=UPI001CB97C06|nr:uncharacterized protein LOC122597508 [Erigeron canadensis]